MWLCVFLQKRKTPLPCSTQQKKARVEAEDEGDSGEDQVIQMLNTGIKWHDSTTLTLALALTVALAQYRDKYREVTGVTGANTLEVTGEYPKGHGRTLFMPLDPETAVRSLTLPMVSANLTFHIT